MRSHGAHHSNGRCQPSGNQSTSPPTRLQRTHVRRNGLGLLRGFCSVKAVGAHSWMATSSGIMCCLGPAAVPLRLTTSPSSASPVIDGFTGKDYLLTDERPPRRSGALTAVETQHAGVQRIYTPIYWVLDREIQYYGKSMYPFPQAGHSEEIHSGE